MNGELVAALVVGALCVPAGAAGPALIARLPEPELDPLPEEADDTPTDTGTGPETGMETGMETGTETGTGSGAEAGAGTAVEPGADRTKRRLFAIAPAHEKVLYSDLAARPRLGVLLALASAVVGAYLGAGLGWSTDLLVMAPLAPLGVWLTYVDWRTSFLPTWLIGPGYGVVAAAIVLASLIDGEWLDARRAVLGWLVYGGAFVLMWLITPGFGYGDVRLAGLLGLALGWLGWAPLLIGFAGGLFLGGILGAVLTLLRIVEPGRNPFGPHMLLAAGISAVFGPALATALGY